MEKTPKEKKPPKKVREERHREYGKAPRAQRNWEEKPLFRPTTIKEARNRNKGHKPPPSDKGGE